MSVSYFAVKIKVRKVFIIRTRVAYKVKERIKCTFLSTIFADVGNSAGIVIERLRVRIPAGAAGECSFPELA